MKKGHSIGQRKSQREKGSDSQSKYALPALVLSIVSLIATTSLGIWQNMSANRIAKLEREKDRTVLETSITIDTRNQMVFQIKNSGNAPALDVVVNIKYNAYYDLKCAPDSPNQDLLPVEPKQGFGLQADTAITYRVGSIPLGGTFVLMCNIFDTVDQIATELAKNEKQSLNSGGISNLVANCTPIIKRHIEDVTKWDYQEISISKIINSIDAYSNTAPKNENSLNENLLMVPIWHIEEWKFDSSTYPTCISP